MLSVVLFAKLLPSLSIRERLVTAIAPPFRAAEFPVKSQSRTFANEASWNAAAPPLPFALLFSKRQSVNVIEVFSSWEARLAL